MLRNISRAALGLLVVHTAVSWNLSAADKDSQSPEEVAAKQDVLAALRAEAAGENNERTKLLTEAWAAAPGLPEANWHTARVRIDEQWLPLGQAASNASNDPDVAKYRALREKAGANPKALRELARWCQKQAWTDRARLHYAQLLGNSTADAAMKKEAVRELDLHQVGDVWLTGEELAARAEEVNRIEAAVGAWRPRLKRLQIVIDSEDFRRRDTAIEDFHRLNDPAIIAVLQTFLADGGDRFQEEAVKRLASFPQYEATAGLVKYAVLSNFGFVRTSAAEALSKRPVHEFAPLLLGGLISPIKSRFQINWDALGRIDYKHAFMREGASGNMLLVSQGLAVPTAWRKDITKDDTVRVRAPEIGKETTTTKSIGISKVDAFSQQIDAARTRAAVTESQVQFFNSATESSNERLFVALEKATNQQLPREPVQWWNWWQGYNEYQWPRPTAYLYQSSAHAYSYGVTNYTHITGTRRMSCFLAGTPVRTETGQRAIESIQPGDRVLAQDADTGELTYKVVLTTTLRPPTKMLRIAAGGEQITTTLGHPFWVSGHGWKMAKELATGDLLHGLGGAVQIEKVEPAGEERAYNLVVDDFNTYFVGQQGLLVHDNEFRKPTRAIVPGLVEELAVAKKP